MLRVSYLGNWLIKVRAMGGEEANLTMLLMMMKY